MKTEQPNPKQAGQGLPERLTIDGRDITYTGLDGIPVPAVLIYDRGVAAELVRRYNSHTELVAALRRARNHLIMSGVKSTDAPEALEQARQALANATR